LGYHKSTIKYEHELTDTLFLLFMLVMATNMLYMKQLVLC